MLAPWMTRVWIGLAVACATPVLAQQASKLDVCPWCRNDPELLQRAGLVSHGPLPLSQKTTTEFASAMGGGTWIFLESAHIRWASSLPEVKVDLDEQERVRAELARLRERLPLVPEKAKTLDPWLRLHLIAMKGEELYTRFQKALNVQDSDFPAERKAEGPFMGMGLYLGEKDKFEVLLHASRSTHNLFTKDLLGVQVTGALRHHVNELHKLLVSIPCSDPDLKQDRWLFPHIAHNLSHLMLDAYKHFSYHAPIWIDEGLALAMEKEIEPRATTREGEEGTMSDFKGAADWSEAVRKMIARGRAKPLAELIYVKEVGELDKEALYTCWSMARYLLDEHPEALAKLLGGIKGQLDEKGSPSDSDLPGLQRKLFKDELGWTFTAFDELWKGWASKPPMKER